MRQANRRTQGLRIALVVSAAWLTPSVAIMAQYPGHIDTKVKAGPVLRSIAVLEWTGEAGKPSASRLVPISVFEDGSYQAGGLYLARPAPLALDSGTEYQLMQSGMPQGIFDVGMAERVGGDWFGYGAWKPLPPAVPVHRLKPSKIDPEVVDGGSDRRPHFRKAAPDTDAPGGGIGSAPPDDPDRPTLRKRAGNAPATESSSDASAAASGNLETATGGGDPDRPKLTHGMPKGQRQETKHLEGVPPNLQQMVAVSDAVTRPEHSFAYTWADPGDAAKLQTQMEEIARKAIAAAAKPAPSRPVAAVPAHAAKPAATSAAAIAARRRALAATKAASTTLLFTDVAFRAFELTYSGGATLVYSAKTAEDDAKARFVTIIAQPDIYGVPQVLFTQVTRANALDASPRLRLIDAVDAAADNRGELLFELRGSTTREFALYRVASGRVDRMIATGALPLGTPLAE